MNSEHQVVRKLKKDACFSFCLYYEALRGSVVSDIPCQEIWRAKAPLKVAFFI